MSARPTIYLKDYQAPAYRISEVDLVIRVLADYTEVEATLSLVQLRNEPLVLMGADLALQHIALNERKLQTDEYALTDETLTIGNLPASSRLHTIVRIDPANNTHLEGLYRSGDLYCTQNEPEGFRKITYFIDRPDNLSQFTTRIEADLSYPTLLANGNLVSTGLLAGNRHYATWQDPTLKPSYLFACVIGNLACLQSHFTTSEGRAVSLQIYTKPEDQSKCAIAMQALKDAMRWDEDNYGCCYDLDVYMIVAVSQFNMGAMENKGLNIFNTACVLADPLTTTDVAIEGVKAVIAHEYFHNWTGNRITCRDWFQLCLKEGFTVYRDQCFSADLLGAAVQRIDDVSTLKAAQFSEDAGPLSHPPRPDHFVEINNFYTATVYEKGAEIMRMIAAYLGKNAFRKGTDHYFASLDGKAVTVEDMLEAISDGSGVDVRAFLPWYTQPGTPTLTVVDSYNAASQTYSITLSQQHKAHGKYPNLQPVPIPVAMALLDATTGVALQLDAAGQTEQVLLLAEATQTFNFKLATPTQPLLSVLRGFSAPVKLHYNCSEASLAQLAVLETDGYNQWQATQQLLEGVLLHGKPKHHYIEVIKHALPKLAEQQPMLASRLLDIPSENTLGAYYSSNYSPAQVRANRQHLLTTLCDALGDLWLNQYAALPLQAYSDTPLATGQRALRNSVLAIAAQASNGAVVAQVQRLAMAQFNQAGCMTERLAALRVLVHTQAEQAADALAAYYTQFASQPLALDLWFGVQASNPHGSITDIQALLAHSDFDWHTPNRVRAVMANLSQNAPLLWSSAGVALLCQVVAQLDGQNPILGARLLNSLGRWRTLAEPMQQPVQQQLLQLQGQARSANVTETLRTLLQRSS